MLGEASWHHPARNPLPTRALGRRAAETAPLLQLLPAKHPFLAALLFSFSCACSAHLWSCLISSREAGNTALSHSCLVPASWVVTEIPKPNVNIDNDSFHKAEPLTGPGVQTHTVPTHLLAKENLLWVPYPFVLPAFQTFAAHMDFCSAFAETELCLGVQMVCKQEDKWHQIFLSARGVSTFAHLFNTSFF